MTDEWLYEHIQNHSKELLETDTINLGRLEVRKDALVTPRTEITLQPFLDAHSFPENIRRRNKLTVQGELRELKRTLKNTYNAIKTPETFLEKTIYMLEPFSPQKDPRPELGKLVQTHAGTQRIINNLGIYKSIFETLTDAKTARETGKVAQFYLNTLNAATKINDQVPINAAAMQERNYDWSKLPSSYAHIGIDELLADMKNEQRQPETVAWMKNFNKQYLAK